MEQNIKIIAKEKLRKLDPEWLRTFEAQKKEEEKEKKEQERDEKLNKISEKVNEPITVSVPEKEETRTDHASNFVEEFLE